MEAGALRPLGIGETLDVAIKVYRARFSTLARAVAVVVAPVYVLDALVRLSLPTADEFGSTFEESATFDFGELWTFLAGVLVTAVASFLAVQLATAASFKIVGATYLGEEVEWSESLRFGLARLGSLIWLSIVFYFLLGLAFLALVLPGVYFFAAWGVAFPVLLFEDVRGRKALKRSRHLVRGRWWPVAAVMLLSAVLQSIVAGALQGVLIGILGVADSGLVDAFANALTSTAGAILVTPFAAAVTMAIYFDLRVRKEGFDLELLARHVGVDPGDIDRSTLIVPPPPPSPPGSQPPFWPPPPGWRPPDA